MKLPKPIYKPGQYFSLVAIELPLFYIPCMLAVANITAWWVGIILFFGYFFTFGIWLLGWTFYSEKYYKLREAKHLEPKALAEYRIRKDANRKIKELYDTEEKRS